MKTNFLKCKNCGSTKNTRWGGTKVICDDCGKLIEIEYTEEKQIIKVKKDITQDEFENLIIRKGASGSFMVFRSDKKEEELGLDQL